MRHRTNQGADGGDESLFVRDTILMPRSILLSTERWSRDWCLVLNFTPGALETELAAAGWTFFLLSNPIHASVYGLDQGDFTATAITRALRMMAQAGLNCLQVEHITRDTFLGAPRVRLEASRRHIQASSTLALSTEGHVPRLRDVPR
jgi:hypothetical protein